MNEKFPTDKDCVVGFTKGLLSGYAGNTQLTPSERASFQIMTSHLEDSEYLYHDEWLKAHTGGGQELLIVKGKRFTRLYAGGTVAPDELDALGIADADVISFLIETLTELQTKTRLFEACGPIVKKDWQYQYQILDSEPQIPITIAKETILYKKKLVFVHSFSICEVK